MKVLDQDVLNMYIDKLKENDDIDYIKSILNSIRRYLSNVSDSSILLDYNKAVVYQENDFSVINTKKSILKAKNNAVYFLENIGYNLKNKVVSNFSKDTALEIIRKILNNFYLHIEVMYESNIHKSAGITKQSLDSIKIVNEYDVQRILYSIIKPIFTNARVESYDDAGYRSVRYDIFIEEYDIVIEVKCSRASMSERSLSEEIGSDAYHYNYNNVFFFVYDKEKIIKNRQAFINAYSKNYLNKSLETIIIQPINI